VAGLLVVLSACGSDEPADAQSASADLARSATATPTATATEAGDAGEPVSIARWSALVCEIAEDFRVALEETSSGTDSDALPIDERIARAREFGPKLADRLDVLASRVGALPDTSDPAARRYADALATELDGIAAVSRRFATEDLQTVTDIETLNAELGIVASTLEEEAALAGAELSQDALVALRTIRPCGFIAD